MKVIDFSIIYIITAICFVVSIATRNDFLYEEIRMNSRYNTIMDCVVEDSLRAGYENVDIEGKPVVNLYEISNYFYKEMAVMLDGIRWNDEYYIENIRLLIYCDEEGYYCYENRRDIKDKTDENKYEWSEKKYYSKRDKTLHTEKVKEILSYIYNNYSIELAVPINDGESYENSLSDYSLISIYKSYQGSYCFSAAGIKKASRAIIETMKKSL